MNIHLGFEVGTGRPVEVPLKHLAVTGQTQESGKTTTLEALIARSGLRAVAFVTKRGEGSFHGGRRVPPYFRERADWQFVESVLESAMRQKMRFERAWIVRATRGARTLADVRRNVHRLQGKATRSMDQDVYMLLGEYLDLVVPLIEALPPAAGVDLRPGLNVMDLEAYPSQMQALVIRSVLEWVYDRERDVVTVIPEAWEFVPQGRGSPVKLAAAQLVRKGAALKNYVWLDSQDLAGVDKEVLKQVAVWLIGVQRETNELKRALAHIPAGVRKPKPDDVATLGRGQFWACWQGHTVKVYVQPAWMTEEQARKVSLGQAKPVGPSPELSRTLSLLLEPPVQQPVQKVQQSVRAEESEAPMPSSVEAKLDTLIELMTRQAAANGQVQAPAPPAAVKLPPALREARDVEEEALYQRFKARLLAELPEEPAVLRLLASKPELRVEVERPVLDVDGNTLRGRLARLLADGWFDEPKAGNAAYVELQRRGFSTAKPNVYREADKLAELGFLTKEEGGYRAVPDMKVHVVKK